MKLMNAALPPIITLTPSTVMGNCPLTMNFVQSSVFEARLLPRIVTQEFGTMPGWKLAPFSTPFVEMLGGPGGAGKIARPQNVGGAWFALHVVFRGQRPAMFRFVHVAPASVET